MKSLIKYIYYPPLSKHFFINTLINKEIINKEIINKEIINKEIINKEEVKNNKNIDYCNIWIRKNF